MLAVGVYISIAVLNVGVAGGGHSLTDGDAPEVTLVLILNRNKTMLFRIAGAVTKDETIRAKNGDWDYQKLSKHLFEASVRWKKVKSLELKADQNTPYEFVVAAMDKVMATHPEVSLGGF